MKKQMALGGILFAFGIAGAAGFSQIIAYEPEKTELAGVPEPGSAQQAAAALNLAFQTEWPGALPERWYAGDYGKKPVVRSQGKYGTCWALSAVSAMEAALLPETQLVLSADHLSLNNAFTAEVNDGGNNRMVIAYLSGWQGPVTEEEDPYGDGYSPAGLSPVVHVQEIQIKESMDIDWIKKMVYEYGAVQTSLFMSKATTNSSELYYNEMFSSYYYPKSEAGNHDVVILGWDDSYSRFHFPGVPETDGAFICQNAWGSDFGEDGIFYVSYADANIGRVNTVYTRIESVDNYKEIYQTDECGWLGSQGYDDEMCWFANVYTARGEEELAAVGFYATAPDAYYEVYLVRDFDTPEDFSGREYLQKGILPDTGYYTIDLEEPRSLKSGERFAVIVKIITPDKINPVAVEYRANEYTQHVTTAGKEGYLSQDGDCWQNTEESYGTNVCLKAYTR